MLLFIIAVFLGLIPAKIAHRKGGDFFLWWVFGALAFIVALPLAILKDKDDQAIAARDRLRTCPKCAEWVKQDATVCKHCTSELPPYEKPAGQPSALALAARTKLPKPLGIVAYSILAILLIPAAIGLVVAIGEKSNKADNSDYLVRISGTPGQAYSGSYGVVTGDGETKSQALDGTVPTEFQAHGRVVTATLQKETEAGELRVEILNANEVVANGATTAPYGTISAVANKAKE